MNSNSLVNIQNGNNQSALNGQNGALNGLNSLNNSNSQTNATNQRNANNKGQQTLPTIYESNHYKETDLQTLFSNFSNGKNDDRPPLPPDPPPSSSSTCYSNSNNKLISFNVLSSSIYHHQPSAVLKQLPTANDEEAANKADKSDPKTATQSNNVQSNSTNEISSTSDNRTSENKSSDKPNRTDNRTTSAPAADPTTAKPEPSTEPEKTERTEVKPFKVDNLQTKFEEEITIYQRPVPLPGRLMKSSSLEDLFKIRVCKLNPLCLNSDPSKAIIFCANPGPLAKIKQSNKSTIESPNHRSERQQDSRPEGSRPEGNRPESSRPADETKIENDENSLKSTESDVTSNSSSVANSSNSSSADKSSENEETTASDQSKEENGKESPEEETTKEEGDSLTTAIAASFKGFLGDMQACKQHQLALSTFRPLSTTAQNATGITGTPNTSSTLAKAQPAKPDPALEQINTMPNPFSFTSRKQSITSQSSQSSGQSTDEPQAPTKPEQQPDITDLLKEFDVCFGDDGANDLISFSNEANRNAVQIAVNQANGNHINSAPSSTTATNNSNANHQNTTTDQFGLDLDFDADNSFNLPPPPPSLLNSTNSSVNVCPSNHLSSSSNSNGCTSNGNCFASNGLPHGPTVDQQSNLVKPPSAESLQYNDNSSFAKLLDQTALKKASLGPATLETCGSKIQLTELDLSEYLEMEF